MTKTQHIIEPAIQGIPLKQVRIRDDFWSAYDALVKETVIPYQWEALHDRIQGAEPSYAIRNFRIAAGREQGEYGGMVFQDSDVAKWLEAVGYALALHPDAELERRADETIDLIAEAQQPDGYLNTFYTVKEPGNRWTNLLDCHEMYCAGHMIEAAVAYYEATGKRKLLEVVCRFADHIDERFGPGPGQIRGYDGHQEVELALVKLYRATGEERYLRLAEFFINERGAEPQFFVQEWEDRGRIGHWTKGPSGTPNLAYHQAHEPVREQSVAVGHAVRAVYMYTGMADLALHTGDEALLEACRRLWHNTVHKQMYITGGIGSTFHGEAFTFDYDLPNETNYSETCASVGLIFWAKRMLQLEAKGEYADVMERALYNTVIAGMAADGKHYFYVNPMEVWPEASEKNPGRRHVKAVRQAWYGCSCCPPNVARLIASLGEYIYTASQDTIYTHLYIGSEASLQLSLGEVRLQMESGYPWNGAVKLSVQPEQAGTFTIACRVPGWADGMTLTVNGEQVSANVRDGYAYITRQWQAGDTLLLDAEMKPVRLYAHPRVRANAGKVALQRGPLVYCLEEQDNQEVLASVILPRESALSEHTEPLLPGGLVTLTAEAQAELESDWQGQLYREAPKQTKRLDVKAVPYYAWGNRKPGEMQVWIRTT
ncbi:glycoside hydrolase family 127 protein [Paenibacillus sp. 1P07SE]|uniref:glycoside hydrolase family 127 protein n=1 Tax=Paenibacillus sp. 1P07SE TaxID=3132209 RepID=UPI0039A4C56D